MIASGASLRKSLDRFSVSLAARMYENTIIIDRAVRVSDPMTIAVGPAPGLATRPNDSVVISLDRRGRSCVVIYP